jgi:hypothetical protein
VSEEARDRYARSHSSVTALQVLVSSAEGSPASNEQAGQAVETVANASPKLGERLKEIGSKIGLSLVSSGIFLAIKSHLGIP